MFSISFSLFLVAQLTLIAIISIAQSKPKYIEFTGSGSGSAHTVYAHL